MRTLSYLASFFLAFVLVTGCDSSGTNTESLGDSTAVAFTQSSVVAPEDTGSVGVTVEVRDPGFKEFSFSVAVDESQSTAALGEDVTGPADTTITFPQSTTAGETAQIEYAVVDDARLGEGEETLTITVSGGEGASAGEIAQFTLTITENDEVIAIDDARATAGSDEVVNVQGVVTRAFGAYARIQDTSGPTGASGIVIRQTGDGETATAFRQDIEDGTIQPGTVLSVRGSVSAFSGLLQFNGGDLDLYQISGQGEPPAPQVISLDEVQDGSGEEYESELVRIEGLTLPDATDNTFEEGSYTAEDADGTQGTLRIQGDDETAVIGEPIPGGTFAFEGVVGQFNFGFGGAVEPDEGYQLIPVRPGDIQ
uniref:Calx-beta domain-containing protein n=1 Tax=uncultured organism TaxID=155900 RepID=M1Q2N3_9ZZZZ|nr:conserved hypothetical protein, secreted [uncultured organism]